MTVSTRQDGPSRLHGGSRCCTALSWHYISECGPVRLPNCLVCCLRVPAPTIHTASLSYQWVNNVWPEIQSAGWNGVWFLASDAIFHTCFWSWTLKRQVCAASTGRVRGDSPRFVRSSQRKWFVFWGLTARLCVGERGHRDREQGKASDSDGRGETIIPSLIRPFPTFLPPMATGCCRPPTARAPAPVPHCSDGTVLVLIYLDKLSANSKVSTCHG